MYSIYDALADGQKRKMAVSPPTGTQVVDKFHLFSFLAISGTHLITLKGVTGILQSIQREDGSGKCFNVVLHTSNGERTVFVRF